MLYRLTSSMGMITDELLESFEKLPIDEYLHGDAAFRYRAFGTGRTTGHGIDWTDDPGFFQAAEINRYAGGKTRRFAPIGDAARRFAERVATAPATREVLGSGPARVGCHQIRIVADDAANGYPTPEGFHQDGFDWVAVTCVAQDNLNGGVSMMCAADDPGVVVFDRALQPGETVLLDDHAVLHYVSPITPKLPGRAHRDVVVVTFDEPAR